MHADVEFGRLQARDMLQHLWTGPISNAAVDVVQGSRSVEVRSVGVTKVYCSLFKTFYCSLISIAG
jgi:trehalose 6-phosphate synthase/phosphatase